MIKVRDGTSSFWCSLWQALKNNSEDVSEQLGCFYPAGEWWCYLTRGLHRFMRGPKCAGFKYMLFFCSRSMCMSGCTHSIVSRCSLSCSSSLFSFISHQTLPCVDPSSTPSSLPHPVCHQHMLIHTQSHVHCNHDMHFYFHLNNKSQLLNQKLESTLKLRILVGTLLPCWDWITQ